MDVKNDNTTAPSAVWAELAGTGSAVPTAVMTNADLEKIVETSDEWITERTGIKTRHIAKNGETTASLSAEAGKKALDMAGMDAGELDLIVCGTVTPEMVFPATACFVQAELGAAGCGAFDLTAACSGFCYAVATASAMIQSGQIKTAMAIGAETLSTITNYKDRTSCILFGDGAGAAVLRAGEPTTNDRTKAKGVIFSKVCADGTNWETLCCKAPGSRQPAGRPMANPDDVYMHMDGRATYQMAVRQIVTMIELACESCDIKVSDIDMIIPHQMNARIIESVNKRLKLPEGTTFRQYRQIRQYLGGLDRHCHGSGHARRTHETRTDHCPGGLRSGPDLGRKRHPPVNRATEDP